MRYRTIVADPPWDIGTGPSHIGGRHSLGRGTYYAKRLPYEPMSVKAIAALPVAEIAEKDARLFLWTINRYLPDAFDVLATWGFRYRQTLVWFKCASASPFPGHIAPNHAEYLLVAVRGNPQRLRVFPSSVFPVPSRSGGGGRLHSRKPDVFLDEIETASPGPYLELFARRQRLGWDTWGNEALAHVEMA
jgi:N6-adenosine-specific RNA methylase IME4